MAGGNTVTIEFIYEKAICLHDTLVRKIFYSPCACVFGLLVCPSLRARTSFSFLEIRKGNGAWHPFGKSLSCLLFLQVEVKQQEEPAGERTGGSHPAGGHSALSAEKVSGGW